jgi:RNA polymerase sigma factor (sigma-70 family)
VRDDPYVVALVTRAAGSDESAWHELVDRYAPLVWSICVRYQLSGADIEDVGQTVWLGLVEQLASEKLREPAALPGWLATTASRECLRVVTASQRMATRLDDTPEFADDVVIDEEILRAERDGALRAAFAELPPPCHQLLAMLFSDPPHSYTQISATLGIRMGSIGPQRARCLERLRRSDTLIALGAGEFEINTPGGGPGA